MECIVVDRHTDCTYFCQKWNGAHRDCIFDKHVMSLGFRVTVLLVSAIVGDYFYYICPQVRLCIAILPEKGILSANASILKLNIR